ncbi:MAG: iron-containing alcohol dehydrogenase [Candidatus Cloacimonadales bacterium]
METREKMWNKVFEMRTKTTNFMGVGAIQKFEQICEELAKDGISKVLIVASKSAYKKTGAWDIMQPALQKHQIAYLLYDQVTPNPTDTSVDEATKLGRDFGAEAVIGIGGGSPIDTAKSVAIMLDYPQYNCAQLYQFEFVPETAKPIIAINTTHGTGTEVNRFAVITVTAKDYKPAIAYDVIYPKYAIDDPALMVGLPPRQTLFTAIDAVNHVTEAATTLATNPYAIMMAKETISLVNKYLPLALQDPQNLEARYYLTYASAIAGIAFDNGLLHLTHALEHPLSALKPDLAHGLGLAMILPAVIETTYAKCPEILAEIYAPIVPNLQGVPEEAAEMAAAVEKWLFDLGINEKLADEGFTEADLDKLVDLAKATPSLDLLLSLSPQPATDEVIRKIYSSSLHAK